MAVMSDSRPCRRRLTYRLYPSPAQEQKLLWMKGAHQELYNALLQQRIEAWRRSRTSLSRFDQAEEVTALRQARPEALGREDNPWAHLNAQSLQLTLRRVDRAFQHFFRRLSDPSFTGRPGFPRFKSFSRYRGWTYNRQSGWRIAPPGEGRPVGEERAAAERRFLAGRHGRLWLQELDSAVPLRGEARDGIRALAGRGRARLKEITLLDQADGWYLSVVVECDELPERARKAERAGGLDWGVSTFATVAAEGTDPETGAEGAGLWEVLPNPRPLGRAREKIGELQREVSRKQKGSSRWHRLKGRLARLHQEVARRRADFLHKATAYLAEHYRLIVTEELAVGKMTRSARGTEEAPGVRVRQKAGLNRSILDTAPGRFAALLAYKAEEAGARVETVCVRTHAPSQTCHRCGRRHRGGEKHGLEDRTFRCRGCGLACDRDYNAARVLLNLGLHGAPTAPDPRPPDGGGCPRAGAPARRREGRQGGPASEPPSPTRQVRRVA